jgi:hypothetical protein
MLNLIVCWRTLVNRNDIYQLETTVQTYGSCALGTITWLKTEHILSPVALSNKGNTGTWTIVGSINLPARWRPHKRFRKSGRIVAVTPCLSSFYDIVFVIAEYVCRVSWLIACVMLHLLDSYIYHVTCLIHLSCYLTHTFVMLLDSYICHVPWLITFVI